MLLFFKPIAHQGASVSAELPDADTGKKKKRIRKITKAPARFTKQLAGTLGLELPDVRGYIEDVLRRESEIIRLKERQAEEEAQEQGKKLLEEIDLMMRKALIARRKRLNALIAIALDYL